jgi:predicted acyltransferase
MPTLPIKDASSDRFVTVRSSGRLLSLDVFRGLTIVGMILVNNPGSWSHLYWPLGHAQWHGWTPTDLVFPFFLFIVGTSLAYSLRKYKKPSLASPDNEQGKSIDSAIYWRIVRRTAVLILLGLVLGLCGRTFNYLLGNTASLDLDTLRFPGVLQRIALVYLATSIVALHVGVRGQILLGAALLFGYWALLAWLPNATNYQANLSPEGNIVRVVDRAVIGEEHMYTQAQAEKTDPEGLLSTLPAIVTALVGYWTGLFVQRRGCNAATVGVLVACGLALAALGLLWNEALPINKKIWTSSYVLLSGGLAMIVFGGALLKFDVWGWRRLARPWEIVGVNAIFVFVASGVVANLLAALRVGDQSVKQWLYGTLFTSWIGDPHLASLAYALATVVFWWIILWAMWRRGWAIRV